MSGSAESGRLIHELLDGSIDREGFGRLQEILLQDAEARRDYYALITTDQLLVDNYGMPHPMPDHLVQPARRGKWLFFGILVIALLLAASVYTAIRMKTPPITLVGSVDSHFLIDGRQNPSGVWKKGQKLEVRDGLVFVRLGDATRACIEGPSLVVLSSTGGDLELIHGKAFIDGGPDGPERVVRAAGAVVRHDGADFGILAKGGPAGEIHVISGSLSLGTPQAGSTELSAGQAAGWGDGEPVKLLNAERPPLRRDPPSEEIVFQDDFSEPKGTPVAGKMPDAGLPWIVRDEHSTTRLDGGRLDTSGGFRHLAAGFLAPAGIEAPVYLMTFRTAEPRVVDDKKQRLSGIERITLLAPGRKPVFSLIALAREDHRWRLRNEITKEESEITPISAISRHELTLRHDTAAGRITLHDGASAQGEFLAEIPLPVGMVPVEFELWNDYGGDLALENITVRAISHAGNGR